MSEEEKIKALESRVHNLEAALHGLAITLGPMLPPAVAEDVYQVARDHFNAARSWGALEDAGFITGPGAPEVAG